MYIYVSQAFCEQKYETNYNQSIVKNLSLLLAATLWWSTAAPKPLKIEVFGGHPAPRGRTAPIF